MVDNMMMQIRDKEESEAADLIVHSFDFIESMATIDKYFASGEVLKTSVCVFDEALYPQLFSMFLVNGDEFAELVSEKLNDRHKYRYGDNCSVKFNIKLLDSNVLWVEITLKRLVGLDSQ